MIENIDRMGKYFGWKYVSGKDETCIAAVVEKYNPEETYLEHDSEEWKTFYADNFLDCQLYEQPHGTWGG